MKLSECEQDARVVITKVRGRGAFRKRLSELGFVRGTTVSVVRAAPLRDPVEFMVMGYAVSLRRREADHIEVIPESEYQIETPDFTAAVRDPSENRLARRKIRHHIDVALIGNPNAGKTSLFNALSGSTERVGNYSGVTVGATTSIFDYKGCEIHLTDLPGTYSLSAMSPDEVFVRQHILEEHPDVILNVLDATNLSRNLFLTTQLLEFDCPIIMALNMIDELDKSGQKIDIDRFEAIMGTPILKTVASRRQGIESILDRILDLYLKEEAPSQHGHLNYGELVERHLADIQQELEKDDDFAQHEPSRFYAIKLLEKDAEAMRVIDALPIAKRVKLRVSAAIADIEHQIGDLSEVILTDTAYAYIKGALREVLPEPEKQQGRSFSDRLDGILTHRIFGFPIFLAFLWLMFQTTFVIGQYPADWIEIGIDWLNTIIKDHVPDSIIKALITDGIITGVGGVIVFLPNILILFAFISFMEDTGYMARVAFIMDKLMHAIGLHGKSFIPLIMGFGCNVPAIMATRTLSNRSDRLITMLIIPFMSCSARLPLFIILAGTFFSDHAGTVIFGVYLLGIVVSILAALLLRRTMFGSTMSEFIMELPNYRLPTAHAVFHHISRKAGQYLRKMGGFILVASILIWVLGYFPHKSEANPSEQLKQSYLGQFGHAIEPAIKPLGMDWRMGVALAAGISAKELVVSTMNMMYLPDHNPDMMTDSHLGSTLSADPNLKPINALSMMVFVLLYFPCVAVFTAVKKESGAWRYAFFMAAYTTGIAWVLSFLVYQIGSLL